MTINRKGIYQEITPDGTVLSDERWQAITLPDGSIHIENETVRLAPFEEPRSDSATIILDRELSCWTLRSTAFRAARKPRVCSG